MPFIAPKPPVPTKFDVCLGPAAGRVDDFWTLAYCPEIDELEKEKNPAHTAFTYIFHYQLLQRTLFARFPRRLDGLWPQSDGTLLAVGNTSGYVEIRHDGLKEVKLDSVPGVFSSIWGLNDDHVFATGVVVPFVYYRRLGRWYMLPLPEGTLDIRGVRALSEEDVYFVGSHGQVHHFDGRQVVRLRVPVQRWLTGIACLDASRVSICGYQGTLLVGNRAGFRHLATNTTDALLAHAACDGRIYYGAEAKVWTSNGMNTPEPVFDFDAVWFSSLSDGVVMSSYTEAKVLTAGNLVDLDVTL